ncbi:exodeoxyribonuclease III [Liquorilactobacillus capillatus]|uniref:Exodeoxyribonuclease III n=1 Tax=Liquorilactobacillus capillatus DSM 19910 TaxID=1423731 RepID=A0A0R1MA15_9LACO|nr:exodeoxyribonuclease III [Liquorilactobacillus capillatus]KRL02660.1 exodeoxyribonuclease III [Liquorilactobacillus capillatus DSM 19910]
MKFISWNVNGLRAILKKDFMSVFAEQDADFFCLQETKLQEGQVNLNLPGYVQYWNYADKKGYSGTAIFAKVPAIRAIYGINNETLDHEGRVITLEYPTFFLVTCYTPNSQTKLKRLSFRLEWETAFLAYLQALDSQKPVILCGDLNVAHKKIDLKNWRTNQHNAGFSAEERQKMSTLLAAGFTDSFRYLHPDETGIYSWWSYRFHARDNNAGWRIDYFITSNILQDKIVTAAILTHIYGSDHCPILLEAAL